MFHFSTRIKVSNKYGISAVVLASLIKENVFGVTNDLNHEFFIHFLPQE